MGESATTSVSNYIKAWLSAQRIIWKEIIENWLKNMTLTIIAIRPECSSFHNTINWVEEVVLFCHFPPLSWLNPIGKLCCADYLEHFGHVVCTLPEGKTSRHSSKLLCTRGRGGGANSKSYITVAKIRSVAKPGRGLLEALVGIPSTSPMREDYRTWLSEVYYGGHCHQAGCFR